MDTSSDTASSTGTQEYLFLSSIRRSIVEGNTVDSQQAGRLIEMAPYSSFGRYLAGSIFLRNGETENARQQFERATELNPENEHAWSALGEIAYRAGDLTKADLYYEKAYEASGSPVAANRLALLRIQGGYVESAKEILTKTLSEYRHDTMTQNNLAISLDLLGMTSEGIHILEGDDLKDPRLLHTRAILQLKEGRPDMAARDLENSSEAGFSKGRWLLMGIVDLQQGRLEMAEDKFRSAIADNPSDHEGYINLGLALRRQGRFSEAAKIYQEGLEYAPHPDLHLNLGVLYELYRSKPVLAMDHYRHYIQLGGPASDRVRGWVEYLEGVVENQDSGASSQKP